MKKTVLIIGASSTFAQAVIPTLAADNNIVTAGRKNCDVYCDVTDTVVIPENIDVVINFVAAFGGTSDEYIETAYQTNVLGLLRICEAAEKAKVKQVIAISSVSALLDEASPYYGVYGMTKKQADELAAFYGKLRGIPVAILRPSQIYGDSKGFATHQPYFYQAAEKAQKGEDITIYGSHDALRNYIHVSDLAEIMSRVIKHEIAGTYACTHPQDVSYSEIALTAQKVFGNGGETVFLQDKPAIPDNIFAWDDTLYKEIAYTPKISLEAGMQMLKDFMETPSS